MTVKTLKLWLYRWIVRVAYAIEEKAGNIGDEFNLCENCGRRKYYDPPCYGEKG